MDLSQQHCRSVSRSVCRTAVAGVPCVQKKTQFDQGRGTFVEQVLHGLVVRQPHGQHGCRERKEKRRVCEYMEFWRTVRVALPSTGFFSCSLLPSSVVLGVGMLFKCNHSWVASAAAF